jgi:L-histidine N-alpha-methyltransferase
MDNQFLEDVISGLKCPIRKLNSKYFYDEKGDSLFQMIMNSEEYYLTNCEFEIFKDRSDEIADTFIKHLQSFDLVELGAGDATKTSFLLKALLAKNADFTYMPIDISSSMINYLEQELPGKMPGLKVVGLNGEYFPMVKRAGEISKRKKAVLFLGGNIGNLSPEEAQLFLIDLNKSLNPGDVILVGFDLKKNPHIIHAAYNDRTGYTKAFNLNLLERINKELGGNFNLAAFEHYNSYDPSNGACKSFLVSLAEQDVTIQESVFHFEEDEIIDMEISQKYALGEVEDLAIQAKFETIETFFDSKRWFIDALWQVK